MLNDLRDKLILEIERICGDEDIGDGAQKTWEQWKFFFADRILSIVGNCVKELEEALELFAQESECGIGFIIGEDSEHTEKCYECKRVMKARAALAGKEANGE